MSYPHGLDKHPRRRRAYIGYTSAGFARVITRVSTRWCAPPHAGEGLTACTIRADSLAEMENKLKSLDADIVAEVLKGRT